MICVVDSDRFFIVISNTIIVVYKNSISYFAPKKHKGTSGLCSQLVPLSVIDLYYYSMFCFTRQVF